MIGKGRMVFGAIVALALGTSTAAVAGRKAPAPSDTPRYDARAEYVVKATVTGVRTHASVLGYEDTHMMVHTSVGEMEVHVGPTAYLVKQGFQLQTGDEVVVTCSKVVYEDKPVLLAREVHRGKQSLKLRNTSGRPAWPKDIGT